MFIASPFYLHNKNCNDLDRLYDDDYRLLLWYVVLCNVMDIVV